MTDPIADMINRIKNAQAVLSPTVRVPFSVLKQEIATALTKEGWIEGFDKKGKLPKKNIEIKLKYKNNEPVIAGIKRVSSPGQKIYLPFSKIRLVKSGSGTAIVSTSQGLMSGREARNRKQGGEILFEIW